MLKAKMFCYGASKDQFGNETVSMSAVYDDGKANKSWSEATPSGSMSLTISNKNAQGKIVQGKEYFIDISPADGLLGEQSDED